LERRLAPWLTAERAAIWREKKIGWFALPETTRFPDAHQESDLESSGIDARKVCYTCRSSTNWLRLLQYFDLRRLLDDTSWSRIVVSSPDFPAHWGVGACGPDPVFMADFQSVDMELYARFRHNIRPIPILASDD